MFKQRVFTIVVILLMVHITCLATAGYSQNLTLRMKKPVSGTVQVNKKVVTTLPSSQTSKVQLNNNIVGLVSKVEKYELNKSRVTTPRPEPGQFELTPAAAGPRWWSATFYQADDVVNFLNHKNSLEPIQAKVTATWNGINVRFEVCYRYGTAEPFEGIWEWKRSSTPEDVLKFLNGTSPYDTPLDRAMVAAVWRGSPDFYVFYQTAVGNESQSFVPWELLIADSSTDALEWINGSQTSRARGRVEICAAKPWPRGNVKYYVFAKKPGLGQAKNIWTVEVLFGGASSVVEELNEDLSSSLDMPLIDGTVITSVPTAFGGNLYTIFTPEKLLVVTRPMFEDSFDEYAQWKLTKGFETYLVTAEWIDSKFDGEDRRHRIRNCLREFYHKRGVRYAMLVGDAIGDSNWSSDEISFPWQLPAGYYPRPNYPNQLLYTMDFWSNIEDYPMDFWSNGDYPTEGGKKEIFVGVVPVRNKYELNNVLYKSMTYIPAKELHFFTDDNIYKETEGRDLENLNFEIIRDKAEDLDYELEYTVFPKATSDTDKDNIRESLLQQAGVIRTFGHGWSYWPYDKFFISNTTISSEDAKDFFQVNPAFITCSCYVFAYNWAEKTLDEAFLVAENGPAVVTNAPDRESDFWLEVLEGRTVGEAFYGTAKDFPLNQSHLFGDPSLVIFDTTVYPTERIFFPPVHLPYQPPAYVEIFGK